MHRYVIRRLVLTIPTLFGITLLVFILVRVMPGDILAQIAGDFGAVTPEMREAIYAQFRLDRNIPQQYILWLGDMASLNLGSSLISGREVQEELARRLPISLQLGAMALFFTIVLGIPIGVISAIRQNSFADYAGRSLAIGILAAPNFWIALVLIAMAGRYFQWAVPPPSYIHFTDDPIANLQLLFVPALLTGASSSGGVMRFARTTMLEVMRQDYIRTARAKGLTERVVVSRHALKNAMIPVVTVIGLGIPGIVTGSIIIEQVYSIPGMGRYYLSSIRFLDYPVVQAINLVYALTVVLANLAVDLTYSYLNPRIRYE